MKTTAAAVSQRRAAKGPALIAGRVSQPGATSRHGVKAKSGNGHGHGSGNGHGAHSNGQGTARSRGRAQREGTSGEAAYDSGLRFDTPGLRYGEDPAPTTPPPGNAKVKLELASRTDANLAAFAEAHATAMTGNANFPTPTPPAAVFSQWLTDFEMMLSQYENAKVTLKNLTEQKDALRAGLCAVFSQRALYVEMTSNGDPDVIASSGLPLRMPPSPVGTLPFPGYLRVIQSQSVGELVVKWNAVASAKSYVLQCAEVVPGEPPVWQQSYVGGKLTSLQKNLLPGKTYAFRVASIGGATGQSDWSPVVERMAA